MVLLRCERRDGRRRVHIQHHQPAEGRLTLQRRDATSALLDRAGEARGRRMASRRRRDLLLPKLLPAHRLEAILHADVPAALPSCGRHVLRGAVLPVHVHRSAAPPAEAAGGREHQGAQRAKARGAVHDAGGQPVRPADDHQLPPGGGARHGQHIRGARRIQQAQAVRHSHCPRPPGRDQRFVGDGRSARRADCGLGARQPPARRVRLCGGADAQPRRRHQRQLPLLARRLRHESRLVGAASARGTARLLSEAADA